MDSYAREYVETHNLTLQEHKPEYAKYGRSATFIRNTLIAENADVVLAFPKGETGGTYDTIKKARKLGKK